MKKVLLIVSAVIAISTGCKKDNPSQSSSPAPTNNQPVYTEKEIYFYSFTDIDGNTVKLSDYKGKKIMFVNTASYCGNTPQYEKLEALYKKYKSTMVILGFPCNQFGDQEPGSNGDIKDFCSQQYHISFPMSSKIEVLGATKHPIYKWLTRKDMNGVRDSEVAWNFQKYLVDEKGAFVAMFENYTEPNDPTIIAAIEK